MYWEVAAGGSSWSQLHQLTLLNRPVQSHHAPNPHMSHCTTTGGGMGLPGPVLAPKEGSHSSHLANKVKKSAGSTEADSDESSSLLLYRGGCDHDQATFVRSAIFYKSELPIVLLQHQNDIMQT